ncbi:hypothetical protein [Altericroceibacterium endophyticum]|uniref:Uncharacterized protein n=1 Tax=Altericroceibacterium endophyticum TaxID=1808508 RepID=A0A6I4T0W7_9SPHN|nr:hypothetical protein [Altericroceibacterium endophyticum]MXO64587.1 hypothetical protein [Altericroceibacterium endophyticum]
MARPAWQLLVIKHQTNLMTVLEAMGTAEIVEAVAQAGAARTSPRVDAAPLVHKVLQELMDWTA